MLHCMTLEAKNTERKEQVTHLQRHKTLGLLCQTVTWNTCMTKLFIILCSTYAPRVRVRKFVCLWSRRITGPKELHSMSCLVLMIVVFVDLKFWGGDFQTFGASCARIPSQQGQGLSSMSGRLVNHVGS